MSAPISEARLQANRQNAQKSTGPSTEAGKSRSRGNALTHGLTATVVDLDEIRPDKGSCEDEGEPGWTVRQVARTMAQIDRSRVIERKLRTEAAHRAATLWDSDRHDAAEKLGAKLQRNPSGIVAELRRTPQGCGWLIARWNLLALMAKAAGGWNAEQKTLAYDLLGVPVVMRTVPITHAVAFGHHPLGTVLSPLEIAVEMLAELAEHTELVVVADAREQILAKTDCVDVPTPDLARLRRYDTALHRRFFRLVDQMNDPAPLPAPQQVPSAAQPQPVADEAVTSVPPSPPTADSPDYETNPSPTLSGLDESASVLPVGAETDLEAVAMPAPTGPNPLE